jgi:hypothetical protein
MMRVLTAAAPAAVPAAMSDPASQSTTGPKVADTVYFYLNINRRVSCGGPFPGSGDIGSCINTARSMWNNHYPTTNYNDVNVYYGRRVGNACSGAWRGVYQGAQLNNLANYTFDQGPGLAGHGQTLDRNIHCIWRVNLPNP